MAQPSPAAPVTPTNLATQVVTNPAPTNQPYVAPANAPLTPQGAPGNIKVVSQKDVEFNQAMQSPQLVERYGKILAHNLKEVPGTTPLPTEVIDNVIQNIKTNQSLSALDKNVIVQKLQSESPDTYKSFTRTITVDHKDPRNSDLFKELTKAGFGKTAEYLAFKAEFDQKSPAQVMLSGLAEKMRFGDTKKLANMKLAADEELKNANKVVADVCHGIVSAATLSKEQLVVGIHPPKPVPPPAPESAIPALQSVAKLDVQTVEKFISIYNQKNDKTWEDITKAFFEARSRGTTIAGVTHSINDSNKSMLNREIGATIAAAKELLALPESARGVRLGELCRARADHFRIDPDTVQAVMRVLSNPNSVETLVVADQTLLERHVKIAKLDKESLDAANRSLVSGKIAPGASRYTDRVKADFQEIILDSLNESRKKGLSDGDTSYALVDKVISQIGNGKLVTKDNLPYLIESIYGPESSALGGALSNHGKAAIFAALQTGLPGINDLGNKDVQRVETAELAKFYLYKAYMGATPTQFDHLLSAPGRVNTLNFVTGLIRGEHNSASEVINFRPASAAEVEAARRRGDYSLQPPSTAGQNQYQWGRRPPTANP